MQWENWKTSTKSTFSENLKLTKAAIWEMFMQVNICKSELCCIFNLYFFRISLYISHSSTEHQYTTTTVKEWGDSVLGATSKLHSQRLSYLTYLVVLQKTPLAELSSFDLPYSLPSEESLSEENVFPAYICQKRIEANILLCGCLRQWTTVGMNSVLTRQD